MCDGHGFDRLVRRWWLAFAVALFFLLPVDLLTTLVAVAKYGLGVEANPVVRWLLERGLVPLAAVHLAVVGLVVAMFHRAVESVRATPARERRLLARFVSAWVGGLLVAGVAVVANNLLVVV
jgi:hypothetical protein